MIAGRSLGRQKIITLPGMATTSKRRSSAHGREVGMHPSNRRFRSPGVLQQIVVEIDADDIDPASGQLDRDPTHSAAGIQDARGVQRLDEVRLAVGRPTGRFDALPPRVVLLEVGLGAPLRPTGTHAVHIVVSSSSEGGQRRGQIGETADAFEVGAGMIVVRVEQDRVTGRQHVPHRCPSSPSHRRTRSRDGRSRRSTARA